MNSNSPLQKIKYSSIPNIILIGNGINRAFGSGKWGDLLGEISCNSFDGKKKENIENLSLPLQAILMTEDNVDEGIELLAEELIKEKTNSPEQTAIIKNLLANSFDAVLTTNYTYEIERSINPDFNCELKKSCKYRKTTIKSKQMEDRLGIYRYMSPAVSGNPVNVWHIHGEIGRPSSVVLGHYYYGEMIACIRNYIPTLIRRYNGLRNSGEYSPLSWIDYFMIGNVYIVGLGLDPSEMDLWWLINCKKHYSNIFGCGKIHWFEPNLNKDENFAKQVLAKINGIECYTENVGKRGFKDYYLRVDEEIGRTIFRSLSNTKR